MLARSAFRRSRTAREMAPFPFVRGTPSGYTRCIDCACRDSDSIQNRHQPAASQPRNCAVTGSARVAAVSDEAAQSVRGAHNNTNNAPLVTKTFANVLHKNDITGVIPEHSRATIGTMKTSARFRRHPGHRVSRTISTRSSISHAILTTK